MNYKTIIVEVEEGVATLTLNRPGKRNAMNLTMQSEFFEAMWQLDEAEAVRAIVVTGAGKGFCAGVDIVPGEDAFGRKSHEQHDAALDVDSDKISELASFWRMDTPVIGAINGSAIGAGLTLALLFDVRYVAAEAKLSFPFTRFGVIPEANSTWLLPRLVGLSNALELLLSGRHFSGTDAAQMGLASRALPAEEVLSAAQELAGDIARNTAPASVSVTKHLVHNGLVESDRLGSMTRETRIVWWLGEQPDSAEGLRAMMEGRAPKWSQSKHVKLPDEVA